VSRRGAPCRRAQCAVAGPRDVVQSTRERLVDLDRGARAACDGLEAGLEKRIERQGLDPDPVLDGRLDPGAARASAITRDRRWTMSMAVPGSFTPGESARVATSARTVTPKTGSMAKLRISSTGIAAPRRVMASLPGALPPDTRASTSPRMT
jgi:hypothetical protein